MEDQNDVLDLDFSNLVVATLDDELLLRQLGRLSVAFNALEQRMRYLLSELVDSPDSRASEILTAGANFKDLLAWFKALGQSRLASRQSVYLQEFRAFTKRCENASKARNRYVHGRWYESKGTTQFIPGRAGRDSPPEQMRQLVTDQDVGAAADVCARLAEELWSTWPSRLGLED